MLSVIEVKCPHCGARGTIMVPPVGSVLIGPCPLCNEMVVLFAGRVMPLEREIMLGSDPDAKSDHLMEVLMEYVRERVEEVLSTANVVSPLVEQDEVPEDVLREMVDNGSEKDEEKGHIDFHPTVDADSTMRPISKQEVDDFLRIDLPLLAKTEYFRAFFGEDDSIPK